MNKKVNTVFFLIGATLLNLIIMFLFIVISLVLISVIFKDLSPNLISILMVLIFIGSIVGAFFVYGRILKIVSRKVDLEKYFLPLFRKKR